MKHLKLLGLATVVVVALIALPADATAAGSVFCTVQESPCPEAKRWAVGTELDFSILSGGSTKLVDTSGETILDSCTAATARWKLEKAEGVTGPIESLTWSTCTFTTTTLKAGKLEVTHIAGGHNGTVEADGTTEVTVNTGLFGSCIYGFTAGTDLGELIEGKPATLTLNAIAEKFPGSNFSCPSTAKWTGTYTLTEPAEKTLSVEPSIGSVFCTVQESPCPEANRWAASTELDFSIPSGKSTKLVDTTGETTLDNCTTSTTRWKVEKVENVTGPIESLTWGTCTFTTATLKAGRLEVGYIGNHNGTVVADGTTEVTVITGLFGSCIYGFTAGADLGTLTEGKPATFSLNAIAEKFTGSAFACPETAKWTGTYTLTEPAEKTLSVESGTTPGPGSVFCTVQESSCPEANRWAAGTELDFSIPSGKSTKLVDTTGETTLDNCTTSTTRWKVEKAEGITGPIESLTWGTCTFTTATLKAGKLEVANIAGTHNGTVKADGTTEVTVITGLFGSCIYGFTAGADLGTLTEGKPATFSLNAIAEKFTGSAFACPETAKWTGTYTLTEPAEKTLSVESG